jgi:hypothetical protein
MGYFKTQSPPPLTKGLAVFTYLAKTPLVMADGLASPFLEKIKM